MNTSLKTGNTLFHQVVAQLPQEITPGFSEVQLQALQQACSNLRWKQHPVDIRFTVPFPGKGFYIVFLSGPERRSAQSRQTRSQQRDSFKRAAGLIMTTAIFSGLVTLGIYQLNKMNHPSAEVFPTVVPWFKDQPSCEQSGRVWWQGACWDNQWSHNF